MDERKRHLETVRWLVSLTGGAEVVTPAPVVLGQKEIEALRFLLADLQAAAEALVSARTDIAQWVALAERQLREIADFMMRSKEEASRQKKGGAVG